jgi:23S rRNA pseudouridine2605 synthase
LLLFTNDGDLAKKLTHPSYKIKKIYQVTLDKPITNTDFDQILQGVKLEDGLAAPDEMAIVSEDKMVLGIEIHIGKNRIVRRIFESLGYRVEKLDRVMFGTLTKKNLGRGKFRHLNPQEINQLKNLSGGKKQMTTDISDEFLGED